MLSDIIYLTSQLVVFGMFSYIGYKIVVFSLVYFFGTNYRLRVKGKDGKYVTVRKRFRTKKELRDWVLETYGKKEGGC